MWDDGQIEGHRRLTRFLKQEGALAATQITHAGRKASSPRQFDKPDEFGPKEAAGNAGRSMDRRPVRRGALPETPVALDVSQMDAIVKKFGEAARRADAAGYDIIEIDGAHGYLLAQFLSPLSNKRNDPFGGDRAGRMKFPLAAAKAVRENWPEHKPMFIRVSAVDGGGGWDVDDTVAYAQQLRALDIDVIDTSSGGLAGLSDGGADQAGAGLPGAVRGGGQARGRHSDHGGRPDPRRSQAEKVLQDGDADLIAIGRQALYNPFWPVHAAQELGCDIDFGMRNSEYGWWLDKRKNNLPADRSATGQAK